MQQLPAPFGPDLKVLVLAGSDRPPRLRRRSPEGGREVPLRDKAFLPLRDRPVIEYVLDWLHASGLERIWVLARADLLARIPARYHIRPIEQPPVTSVFVNLSRAHAALDLAPDEPVLVVFGDHPLNTPAALRDFLRRCAALLPDLDFAHAFALREAYAELSPYFTRTCLHSRDASGRATGISLAVPGRLHRLRVLDEIYGVRKQERLGSFFGLLWTLGRGLGLRSPRALFDASLLYLAKEAEKVGRRHGFPGRAGRSLEAMLRRRVPMSRLEDYAGRILQAERRVRLVPVMHGGLGVDVDFREELNTLERHWDALQTIVARQDAGLNGVVWRSTCRDGTHVDGAVAEEPVE